MDTITFSSSEFEPEFRGTAIEHMWSDQLRMDIDFTGANRPSFKMKALALPNVLSLSAFSGTASQLTRNPSQAATCENDLILCVADGANVRVSKSGDKRVYTPGDAHVWLADRSTTCEVDSDYSAFMLSIPSNFILKTGVDLERILAKGIPTNHAEMRMLTGYTATLIRELDQIKPETIDHAAAHLRDLALLALSSAQEKAHIDSGASIRAVRLARIKADISENLLRPELSVEWIAAREGISPRYLRDLFSLEQTNFTDFTLFMRLQRAYQLLTDPRQCRRRVSEIAYECGFGDLSYFNRRFKRCFDVTPSEIRAYLRAS